MAARYKCPYCDIRLERKNLITHIDKTHQEMIPDGFTAARLVYNIANKTDGRKCRVCGTPTKWREDTGGYAVLCDNPKCKEAMREEYKKNMLRVRGTYNILNNPDQQKIMLANRSISGEYEFTDGGKVGYTGTYERKCLEFMDIVMHIPSKDILSPGPVLMYFYKGEIHTYIPDFYYIPYNLIIEVKDGGNNLNTKHSVGMDSSREKTIEKERMITDKGEFNYIRLTNNQFPQLIEIFMDIKTAIMEGNPNKVIRINENKISILKENADLTKFTYYHAELAKNGYDPKSALNGWDEELYSKDIDSCIRNDIKFKMKNKNKVTAHLFTMGEDYDPIYLGTIYVYKTSNDKIDWEWRCQEPITQEMVDYIKEEIQNNL